MALIELNSSTFREAVSTGTVLLDFWAPWCSPCKAMTPHLEKLSLETPSLIVAKVDASAEAALSTQYRVAGLPTLIIMKNGKEVARKTGGLNLSALKSFVTPHL